MQATAGTLGYLATDDLRAVQEPPGHSDPRTMPCYANIADTPKGFIAGLGRRTLHLLVGVLPQRTKPMPKQPEGR